MKGTDFDSIVKNRADERVIGKIKTFRDAFAMAFNQLTGTGFVSKDASADNSLANWKILTDMADKGGPNELNKWPHYLWETEEGKVRSELLSVMDEMQKALLAPEPTKGENDDTPAPKPEA